MGAIVVRVLMVVVVCAVLYMVYVLGKQNPTMIVGFRWGITASEVAEDKRWLKKFCGLMRLDMLFTFVAGILAAFTVSIVYYLLVLAVPTLFTVAILYLTMPRGGMRM